MSSRFAERIVSSSNASSSFPESRTVFAISCERAASSPTAVSMLRRISRSETVRPCCGCAAAASPAACERRKESRRISSAMSAGSISPSTTISSTLAAGMTASSTAPNASRSFRSSPPAEFDFCGVSFGATITNDGASAAPISGPSAYASVSSPSGRALPEPAASRAVAGTRAGSKETACHWRDSVNVSRGVSSAIAVGRRERAKAMNADRSPSPNSMNASSDPDPVRTFPVPVSAEGAVAPVAVGAVAPDSVAAAAPVPVGAAEPVFVSTVAPVPGGDIPSVNRSSVDPPASDRSMTSSKNVPLASNGPKSAKRGETDGVRYVYRSSVSSPARSSRFTESVRDPSGFVLKS